jgi:hypothetical protein
VDPIGWTGLGGDLRKSPTAFPVPPRSGGCLRVSIRANSTSVNTLILPFLDAVPVSMWITPQQREAMPRGYPHAHSGAAAFNLSIASFCVSLAASLRVPDPQKRVQPVNRRQESSRGEICFIALTLLLGESACWLPIRRGDARHWRLISRVFGSDPGSRAFAHARRARPPLRPRIRADYWGA